MVTEYIPEYVSVWDALQTLVAQFGGWIGYKWVPDYNDFRLTLLIPPRGKDAASADWAFDGRQIIVQHLDISDRDVRNAVVVTYRDSATGTRQSVTLEDAASIAEFGRRAMQIEEADTSLIDTQAEATALAQVVVHDLKDLTAATRLIMPLVPTMDVFDGVLVTNPRLSSTQDFYAVESVEHVLDFDRGQFRTEVIASGRVVGAHTRWLLMETRPGSPGQPIPKTPKYRLIVAAKDSDYNERRNADYFCDGVADQEQINAAVAALGNAGGEVLLLKGTYVVDSSIYLCSGISLVGQGAGTVIKVADGVSSSFAVVSNVDTAGGNADIRVSSLQLDGNSAKVSGLQRGVGFYKVQRGQVRDVWIASFRLYGVQLYQSVGCSVVGCTVRDCLAGGIIAYASSDCTIANNTTTGNGASGIYISQGSGHSISGNVSADNKSYGISCASASYLSVAGNTCTGNGSYGIGLTASSSNITVSGNTCEGNAADGILLNSTTNCSVSSNVSRGNGHHGIQLYASSHNNVQGNTCADNSQEVNATYDNIHLTANADYNTVQSNTCRRGTGANQPRYGIRVNTADCDGNMVTNNDLYTGGATANFSDAGTGTITTAGNRA